MALPWSPGLSEPGGPIPPPPFLDFDRSVTLSQTGGKICPPHYHLDFQTFLQPWSLLRLAGCSRLGQLSEKWKPTLFDRFWRLTRSLFSALKGSAPKPTHSYHTHTDRKIYLSICCYLGYINVHIWHKVYITKDLLRYRRNTSPNLKLWNFNLGITSNNTRSTLSIHKVLRILIELVQNYSGN